MVVVVVEGGRVDGGRGVGGWGWGGSAVTGVQCGYGIPAAETC